MEARASQPKCDLISGMKHRVASLGLALAITPQVHAQEDPIFRSENVEGLAEFKGDKAARSLLLRRGFVVTGETCKQIFSPYTPDAVGTYFVTVDTIIHTYTMLLAQALLEIEQRQTWVLKRFTQALLDAVCAVDSPESRSVGTYLGMALLLQDPSAKGSDGAVTALKNGRDLLGRWRKAGVGSASLKRARFFGLKFNPALLDARGIYTRNGRLRRYHAARRFFQLSPLFEDSQHERACVMLLRASIARDPRIAKDYALLQDPFIELLGAPDSADLRAAIVSDAKIRDSLVQGSGATRRLLPAARIPSGEVFARTTHPEITGRYLPSGLEVLAVGPLSSAAGKRAFRTSAGFAPQVLAAEAPDIPDSIHGRALRLLSSLQNPLPANAPLAFRSEAWRDKQCATQLAGWADLRTVWSLHAKMSFTVLSRYPDPEPGLVSPYPQVFAGYAKLAQSTLALLRRLDDQLPLDERQVAAEIGVAPWLRRGGRGGEQTLDALTDAEAMSGRGGFRDGVKRLVERVKKAEKASPSDRAALLQFLAAGRSSVEGLPEFAKVCDVLSDIAAKQLEGRELDDDQCTHLKGLGESLARLDGYTSNSWASPRDDHPRSVVVAGVFNLPASSTEYLEVGLARPEILYVIVKRHGKARLYRGAVLSYRSSRSKAIRTAGAWNLHSKSIQPPRFTRSFRSSPSER